LILICHRPGKTNALPIFYFFLQLKFLKEFPSFIFKYIVRRVITPPLLYPLFHI
jgi:hypothetical protein